MGKRGPKPRRIISERWTPELAYAIGLLATDGCLVKSQSLIDLTSREREQLVNYRKCLGVNLRITSKMSGGRRYLRIQFKNVYFYNFLLSVGLTPAKSKTLGALKIPSKYFWDFLRGVYDGDGTSYSYWDPRWKSSFMFYTSFASASKEYIGWLRKEVHAHVGVAGHMSSDRNRAFYQLRYAKKDSLKVLRRMYHSKKLPHLSRKRLKVEKMLRIVGERL